MKKDKEEDEEKEGKSKDKKRICINPFKISLPLNFAPRPSRTPERGGGGHIALAHNSKSRGSGVIRPLIHNFQSTYAKPNE